MFNQLSNLKAKIFTNFISKLQLKPNFTLFIITDNYIKSYAKHIGVTLEFLLKSPDFFDIVKNHITYNKLPDNTKTRFTTLSEKSFVFNSIDVSNPVIDDVRGEIFGIKLHDKIITKEYTTFIINGILIQSQSPYSYLEALPKDPFHHLILVGDFKSKDIMQLCNISNKIRDKCIKGLYVQLLQKLHIDVENNDPKKTYEDFASNPLQWMIKHHPNEKWDWTYLSKNPSLTWEFIQANQELPWVKDSLAQNPSFLLQFLKANPKYSLRSVAQNPALTWEIFRSNDYSLDGDDVWVWLSRSSIVTPEIVQKTELPWNWEQLSENPNITPEFIESNLDKNWDWINLSSNPGISFDIVKNNLNKWNWFTLSSNPIITPKIVKENPNFPWNWEQLSANPSISWKFVEDNIDKNWDWELLARNPAISIQNIKDNPNKPWNWYGFSVNPNATWNDIQTVPNEKVGWSFVSENPNITWDIIQENIKLPWSWEILSFKTN